jgi:two-component system NtrC family response regulator
MVTTPTPAAPGIAASGARAALTLAEMERQHIAAALERTGWHQGRAAEELGISVKTLYRKIRAYGFQRPGARNR